MPWFIWNILDVNEWWGVKGLNLFMIYFYLPKQYSQGFNALVLEKIDELAVLLDWLCEEWLGC